MRGVYIVRRKRERERESINRVFRSRSRVTIERHYARANRLRKTKMHELIFRAFYVKRDYVSSLSFNVKLIPRFAASSFPIVFLRYQNRTCSVCLIVFAFNRVYEISTRRARITLLARILFSFFPSFLLLRYVTRFNKIFPLHAIFVVVPSFHLRILAKFTQ